YFAAASGAMQTGVVKVDDKIYYLDAASGAMQVGNVTISGKNYTFALTGEAVGKDIPPVSKAFNSSGIEITGANNSDKSNNGANTSTTNQQNNSSSSNNSSGSSNNGSSGNNGGGSNNSGGGDINAGVSTSYLENYREQYHYSPAKAWANDPNGMVYFNGEYHLFYQYYPDDVVWGPMHWGHAVSTDLIHWKELGIAIAPDGDIPNFELQSKDWYKYGEDWIYSGSAVVDKDNTSGFFDGIEGGGLVAIYTQHIDKNPRIEEQCIAYSKDNGRTWIKPTLSEERKNQVLSIEDDPLQNRDFRDPKIFYNEEAHKWMMVTAGGPLRFFSSTDLKNWKPEAMQPDITTECPDFFKLKVEGTDEEKWVLSEGGRYYRVGDFKEVDGVWTFVPDSDDHIPMNFAKDAYAAQTYYGTGENGTPDGRRIMINWMNNWDYCQSIGKITGTFNGQYTLQNELKLVNTADGIRLVQQPIKEYESLRQAPTTFNNVTISPDQPNIMSNIQGSQYEIVAEFQPDEKTTEVGFKLRVGKEAGQETIVKYNTQTGEVTLDRSKSGKGSSNFLQSYSSKMNKTADGKIQLHIYVDASSVEVYGDNGEVTGTAQIFPNRTSQGIEVYSLGGNTKATINYYPLKGIWNNDVKGTNSVALSLSESNFTKEVGEQFSIYTTTIPATAAQGVNWTISDPSIVKIISQDDTKTTFEVTGKGTTDLTATSKDGKSTAKSTLSVYDRVVTPDISNLTGFQSYSGNWYVENGTYIGDGVKAGDAFAISDQKNDDLTATYTFTADAKILDGGDVAALTLFSKEKDPFKGSIVANIIKNGDWRVFNFPGGQNVASGHIDPAPDNIYHLKAEIKGSHIKYWINDQLLCDADQNFYDVGNFGLGVCNAKVEFTNARLNKVASDTSTLELNKTAFEQKKGDIFSVYSNQKVNWSIADSNIVQLLSKDGNKSTFEVINSGATTLTATSATNSSLKQDVTVDAYELNPETVDGLVEGLTNFQTHNGNWYVKDDAYQVNVSGDGFSTSDTKIDIEKNPDTTYTLEADANFIKGDVAELVLFAQSKDDPQGAGSLVANVIDCNKTYNLFTFGKGGIKAGDLDDANKAAGGKYHLKAEVKGTHLKYTINDQVIYDGEQNFFTSGYLGLGACNANVAFTNIKFTDDATAGGITDTTGAAVTVTTGAAITVATPVTGETPVSTIDET
ncbi:GH32 C-terminal domain-containing protein, partial [Clostridium sp. LS]